jgi:hypothetical protein
VATTALSCASFWKALLKTGLLSGCAGFLFYRLDLAATADALARFSPVKCGILSLWFLTSFVLLGGRIYAIGQGRMRLTSSIAAVFLGFFANSIFPARIGEGVKGLYLKLASKKSIRDILTLVFWERFCDLNMIFLVVTCLFITGDIAEFLAPVFFVTVGGWAALAGIHLFFRNHSEKIQTIRRPWLQRTVRHLSGRPDAGTLLKLVFFNLLVWGQFVLEMLIGIYWVAGFTLPLSAAIYVFIVSSLAFAIPASPGGLGVYDAAIVFSLGKYGIPAGDAMAFAIMMRTIQYVPTLLIGCAMVTFGGAGLQEIFRPASARKMLATMSIHQKTPAAEQTAEVDTKTDQQDFFRAANT